MNFSGKYGSSPRISALSAPPRPARPQPNAKVKREHLRHVDAEPAGRARIVDRGAQPAAEPRARQDQLQRRGQQAADHDDHQPVAADADAEEIDLALERRRKLDEDPRRSHDVVDRRHRHEDEADAEQHLVEMAAAVEVTVERALQHRADQRAGDEGQRQAGEERPAGAG